MRREDNERQRLKRKDNREKRAKASHSAAFVNGNCLLSLMKYTDYAKRDELEAQKIMAKLNKKKD